MAPTGGKVVVAFLLISIFAAQTYGLNCLVVRPGKEKKVVFGHIFPLYPQFLKAILRATTQ